MCRSDTLGAVLWLLSITFILPGCDRAENTTPYKVVDSGMWTSDYGGGKAWWLDNERILFPSNEKLVPGGGPTKMMVWNLSTGRVEPSPLTSVICAREGQVFFARRDNATNRVTYYRGPLENPREYPPPGPDMRLDDRFGCGWAPKTNFGIVPVNIPHQYSLLGENYLEFVERSTYSKVGKMVYHERPGSIAIPMPFYITPFGYEVSFCAWRDAYLVSPGQYIPDDPYYHSLWWLERDGKIKKERLPLKLPWPARGATEFYPIKAGFLALYNGGGSRSMTNSGARGLYLVKGEKIQLILGGSIHGVSVSHDGCRVAFSHAKNTKEYYSQKKPNRTLKIINLCAGGKGK